MELCTRCGLGLGHHPTDFDGSVSGCIQALAEFYLPHKELDSAFGGRWSAVMGELQAKERLLKEG